MRLETPRLVLCETQIDDAAAFSEYNERPAFYRYITKRPDRAETLVLINRNIERNQATPRLHWYFSIVIQADNRLIGDIALGADARFPDSIGSIGYGINPDVWGQGYMTEALQAMTIFGHETLGFHRLATGADLDNPASWRVMEKCGYVREGVQAYAVRTPFGWSPQTVQYASVRPDLIKP